MGCNNGQNYNHEYRVNDFFVFIKEYGHTHE